MAIWQHDKRVLSIFILLIRRNGYSGVSVKTLTCPFASATSISCKTNVFTLSSNILQDIFDVFGGTCDLMTLTFYLFDLESVAYTGPLMPDLQPNFNYPTTVSYWVTDTEFDHISDIWKSLRMRCVTWLLLRGKNGPHFWSQGTFFKSLTPIYLLTLHFQGATTKIRTCYCIVKATEFTAHLQYRVICAQGIPQNHT